MMRESVLLKGKYFYKSDIYGGYEKAIWCVTFSSNGKLIATGDGNGNVKIWKLKGDGGNLQCEWEIIKILQKFHFVRCLSFSKDNTFLLSGYNEWSIVLIELNTFKKVKEFIGHDNYIFGLLWISDNIFASCSNDKTIKVWIIDSEKVVKSMNTVGNCLCIAMNNSKTHIATGHGYPYVVNIWDASSFVSIISNDDDGIKLVNQLPERHTDVVRSIDYSVNNILASASEDQNILLWNANTTDYQLLATLKGHSNYIYSISFSPDGMFVVSGSFDNTIRYWDSSTFECIDANSIHSNFVYSVAFSPFSDSIVSVSSDKTMMITSFINSKVVIEEQVNLMQSLLKTKIRTPHIIIDYFGDFMMNVKYRQINNNNHTNNNKKVKL